MRNNFLAKLMAKIYTERNRSTKLFIIAPIFFLGLFGLVKSSLAADMYYVSPSGNDINPGTEASPFRNIQRAADIVNPGDTVIVKDGTYSAPTGTYNFIA